MSFRLSVKDIDFIRPFATYLKIFVVLPWYDFDTNTVQKPTLLKLYACSLFFARIFLVWDTVVHKNFISNLSLNVQNAQKFLHACANIDLYLLYVVTTFKAAFWDGNRWKTLFMKLQYLDVKLQNKGKKASNFRKNLYLHIIAGHIFFVFLMGYQLILWYGLFGGTFFLMFVSVILDCYYRFLIVLLINCILESVKSRYQDLNTKLILAYRSSELSREVGNLAQDYRILGEVVQTFNKIFGYQMIMIMFSFGVELIMDLATGNLFKGYVTNIYYHIIVSNLLMVVFTFYNLLIILLPVHQTLQQSKKFVDLCFQIKEHLNEECKEVKALKKLIEHAKNFPPEFNASGYFRLDKSIIFGLIGNVTTYFIITIQFAENKYD